jgi:hypothetical protein
MTVKMGAAGHRKRPSLNWSQEFFIPPENVCSPHGMPASSLHAARDCKQFKKAALIVVLAVSTGCAGAVERESQADTHERTSYGDDDRVEASAYSETSPEARWSKASAILTMTAPSCSGVSCSVALDSAFVFCGSETGQKMLTGGYCTAFLVAPDRMVTAAHCFDDSVLTPEQMCANVNIIFDFTLDAEGNEKTSVPAASVNLCKSIVAMGSPSASGSDWAVFTLEQPVSRSPLITRRAGDVTIGDTVRWVGHPTGRPQKIGLSATIEDVPSSLNSPLRISSDTFRGDSGAPFISDDNNVVVEALLSAGNRDYFFVDLPDGGACLTHTVCSAAEGCQYGDGQPGGLLDAGIGFEYAARAIHFAPYVPLHSALISVVM